MLRQSSFYEAKFETPSLAVLENEIDGYRLLQKRAEPFLEPICYFSRHLPIHGKFSHYN